MTNCYFKFRQMMMSLCYAYRYRNWSRVTMATSGKIIKMEVDFSDTVDKKLPEYQELAQVFACI